MMKEREPRYVTIRQRLEARGDRMGDLTPSSVAAMSAAGAARGGGRARPQSSGVIRPGASRGAGRQPAATGAVRPGASKGAPAAKAPGARTPSSGGGANRPAGTRPPPRPRKGKGKGGKGKRR
jgi:hypothetical protein